MGLFGKQLEAEAVILEDEAGGKTIETDTHGIDWEWHKYVIEVRPAGAAPFRTETKAKVAWFCLPEKGDTVKVLYDLRKHSAEIQIHGDPRYDARYNRSQVKEQKRAEQRRVDALLAGEDPGPAPGRPNRPYRDDADMADLEAVERLEAEARNREG